MRIRKAKLTDLPGIERWLHRTKELQSPTGHDLGPSYNRQLIKDGIGLVAEVEERLAGFLLAEADRKTGYSELLYLVVVPKYRGRGLGATLLHAYLDTCRKGGIRLVTSLASASNRKAMDFFKKHGFSVGKPMTPFSKTLRQTS